MERATKLRSRRSRFIRLGFSAGVGLVIWYMPVPEGVRAEAWHLLAIFVATIVAIILEPLPMGAVAVLGIGTYERTEKGFSVQPELLLLRIRI